RGAVALVVIVGIGVDRYAAFANLIAKIDPTAQLLRAIHNHFVPRLSHRLDFVPVSEPADVGEVRCDWIELQRQRISHPRTILKYERDSELSKEVREIAVDPVFVTYLDCVFVGRGQLPKKWHEAVQKFMVVRESAASEVWKLEHNGAEFLAEDAHRFQELVQLGIAVDEYLLVRNRVGNLHEENEVLGRFRQPTSDRSF